MATTPQRIEELRRQRLEQIPSSMRATYEKATAGRSRRMAIKAFCQECCGYDRRAVAECSTVVCPLWPYRPYQKHEDADDA